MKTYRYKLYRNDKKFKYLDFLLDTACDIYNFALSHKQSLYDNKRESISKNDLQKLLVQEKATHKGWEDLGSQVVQQITDRIYAGYVLFFKNCQARKRGETKRIVKKPKCKKTYKYKSITFKQAGYKLYDNQIRIGDKYFKFHKEDRAVLGNIKTLTVKRNKIGEYFICLTTDYVEPIRNIPRSGNKIGYDFGLSTFLIANTSKKDDIKSPLFLKADSKNIKKLHRSFRSKQKGSNNWHRARIKLSRAYEKITNKRENYHWQLANQLVRQYDVIFLETLDIDGIRRRFGKKINDLGLYDFLLKLKWQSEKYGKQIVQIDRWYPSSKTCSNCEYYNGNLTLYDRKWTCPECHIEHNRDRNAANNIYRVGTSTLAGDYVRPSGKQKAIVVDSTIRKSKSLGLEPPML